jgi:phenylalanyl-tRNA synthetase alpha chain
MHDRIAALRAEADAALARIATRDDLDAFRVRFLARKGDVAALFDALRTADAAERPALGKLLNELRAYVQQLHDARAAAFAAPVAQAGIDLTIPGRRRPVGTQHPITRAVEEISSIFVTMGFGIADGPEAEDDYHNFGALNFAPDHPARDMQDTFFLSRDALLRTHTSPVQIRVMETCKPPVRVIMPGKVYRNEAVSARSLCAFHQVEALYVDRGVTFADLKGTVAEFVHRFYGADVRYKFQPSFFPFTEPSAEVYITCFLCGGKGCRMCKQAGWLEVMGCGMVDPNVFRSVGYDPEKVSGFALGMGIERVSALRYGVDDLRLFYENDVRFLNQF